MYGKHRFVARTPMPVSPADLYAWHLRPGAFERLTPPWEPVRVLERDPDLVEGSRVVLGMSVGPATLRWVAVHSDFVPGRRFRDVQESGPFAVWSHNHRFLDAPNGGSILEDDIEYTLPMGAPGRWFGSGMVRGRLERMFSYRHAVTRADLSRHLRSSMPPMTVAISGASGLVGSALGAFLRTGGHRVLELVRREARSEDEISYDPKAGTIDAGRLEGLDAVVHLAGENIAGGRWTEGRKASIRDSRIRGTALIAETLSALRSPPSVLIGASAIGIYGDRGSEIVDESSPAGTGFLAEVSEAWESACEPARRAGVRVANVRIGIVLAAAGGALARMAPLFRAGLGGRLGDGRQFMSWIALDDLVGAIHHGLIRPDLHGPYNAVSPGAVDNTSFTDALARVVRRPAFLPAPAIALRLALGEMADALLLTGARVEPKRLRSDGFAFRFEELEPALRFELGRTAGIGNDCGTTLEHRTR